jgi:hypothetical protein
MTKHFHLEALSRDVTGYLQSEIIFNILNSHTHESERQEGKVSVNIREKRTYFDTASGAASPLLSVQDPEMLYMGLEGCCNSHTT